MGILPKQYIPIADGKYLLRSTEHEKNIKVIIEDELINGYEPISLCFSENIIPGSDYYYVLLKKVKETELQKKINIIKNP